MAQLFALEEDGDERREFLLAAARRTRGFMPDDEGAALYRAALRAGQTAVPGASPSTFVEIGAWCGKSTVYLGAAAEATPLTSENAVLRAIVRSRSGNRYPSSAKRASKYCRTALSLSVLFTLPPMPYV